ncbi:MAG TPA: DoxX family protein [Thermoanaerobaculia bacterium]|jgi:putative oxidoreductase|nr:DoxX family protein [Thermoanaerobaculia bacterium]
MRWFLNRYSEPLFAVLRVVVGLLFACHGADKLFGAFGGQVMTGVPLMLAAGIIELAGGLLIAVGLFTEIAAFVCSGEMAVAYFQGHFPSGFWPIQNHGELAVVYCFVFLYIAAHGSGPFSLDSSFGRARR